MAKPKFDPKIAKELDDAITCIVGRNEVPTFSSVALQAGRSRALLAEGSSYSAARERIMALQEGEAKSPPLTSHDPRRETDEMIKDAACLERLLEKLCGPTTSAQPLECEEPSENHSARAAKRRRFRLNQTTRGLRSAIAAILVSKVERRVIDLQIADRDARLAAKGRNAEAQSALIGSIL